MEGELVCPQCGARYPIRGGVPRFVSGATYADSFGFEWQRFRRVQLDSANGTRQSEAGFGHTGLAAGDVCGRLVLDAGVGAGRYAEVVSAWGGEVVGVDLSGAVDAAFGNLGRRPGVHIVQADLFALPFRQETFDIGYSIGVLHHTPAPEKAFRALAAVIKTGGHGAIYVYPAGGLAQQVSDVIRRITVRLPHRLLALLTRAAVILYYAHRLPVLGRVFRTILPISMHPDWRWRWLDTFDWYSPRYQSKHTYPEIFEWFREAGFNVLYVEEAIWVRGRKVTDVREGPPSGDSRATTGAAERESSAGPRLHSADSTAIS
jgi:SAM-dependent methyltransferase